MSDNKKYIIEKNEIFKLLIFIVLTVIGIGYNKIMLLVAVIYVVYNMLKGDLRLNFYYGLFLIPNIRIFDSIGITFLVNILLAIPLAKYLIKYKFRLSAFALCSTTILFIVEFIHIMVLGDFSNIVSTISCFISMLYCLLITTKCDINIEPEMMWRYFIGGIFTSAFVYLVTNPSFTVNIVTNVIRGYRFSAFASDPNYFSLYICIALAYIFTKNEYILSDYILLMILVIFGMLTASKMCLLVMFSIILFGFFHAFIRIGNISKRRFLFVGLSILLVCVIIFNDQLLLLLNNLLRRAGMLESSFSVSKFTTGRYDILKDYMSVFNSNMVALLFGYGMQYHLYLSEAGGYVAHNTYFDVALSWGILGTIVFTTILVIWKKKIKMNKVSNIIDYLPMIVLMVVLLSLSCLSATMFWWVLSYVLIVADKKNERELCDDK